MKLDFSSYFYSLRVRFLAVGVVPMVWLLVGLVHPQLAQSVPNVYPT
jgi:hypothetical protein